MERRRLLRVAPPLRGARTGPHGKHAAGRALPVATGYSGNLQFMDAANSFLVSAPHGRLSAKASYPLSSVGTLSGPIRTAAEAARLRCARSTTTRRQAAARKRSLPGTQHRQRSFSRPDHRLPESSASHLAEIGDRCFAGRGGEDLPAGVDEGDRPSHLLKEELRQGREVGEIFRPSGLFRLRFPAGARSALPTMTQFQRKTHRGGSQGPDQGERGRHSRAGSARARGGGRDG